MVGTVRRGTATKLTNDTAVRPREYVAFATPVPTTSYGAAATETAVRVAARHPAPSLGVLEHAIELAARYSLMRSDRRGHVVSIHGGLRRVKGGDA